MSELITIKAKSKTGQVVEIQVAEILEIDGKFYRPTDEVEELKALVNHLSGRIASVESVLGNNGD